MSGKIVIELIVIGIIYLAFGLLWARLARINNPHPWTAWLLVPFWLPVVFVGGPLFLIIIGPIKMIVYLVTGNSRWMGHWTSGGGGVG